MWIPEHCNTDENGKANKSSKEIEKSNSEKLNNQLFKGIKKNKSTIRVC